MTCSTNAAHCKGVETQSFITTFEAAGIDTNNSLIQLYFSQNVGISCREVRDIVSKYVKTVDGFHVPGWVTVVDQEKSIAFSYSSFMKNANIFSDMLQVNEIVTLKLGKDKASALRLYERAVYACARHATDKTKSIYST